MIASFDHRLVLLCNPKTATTSLEAALRKDFEMRLANAARWKHMTYFGAREIFGDTFERAGCDFVTVVRDPLDTLNSWYRYRSRQKVADQPDRSTVGIGFEEFVDEWAARASSRARVRTSVEFCYQGETLAPGIYWHYDALPKLVDFLSDRIGKAVELPMLNVSKKAGAAFDREALMNLPRVQDCYRRFEKIPARQG